VAPKVFEQHMQFFIEELCAWATEADQLS